MAKAGRLIVFEGGEGSGKTTQIQRVQAWLEQQAQQAEGRFPTWVTTREPGGTKMSQQIRQLLLGDDGAEPLQARTELLLYAADRAQHVEFLLRPQLANGALILCDRYTDSTIAYQGYGRGLDRSLIDQLNQIATNGLASDLTFWLDVPVEVGLARTQKRGAADRIEQAALSFHQRVYQGFSELAQQHPERIVRIDASRSEGEVTQQLQAVLTSKLQEWFTGG
jgi:dTMP kinase